MQKNDVALRKRQQIAKANRAMFLGVAGASAIVGAAIVLSFVLVQKLIFNEKVLFEKQATVGALQHNNEVAEKLKANIRVLNTNESLLTLQTEGDTEPAQVVLDALPATANSAALGASLQSDKLLAQPGITIESLTVDPVAGVESDDGESSSDSDTTITFSFTVSTSSSNADGLKDLLKRIERSIRTINITQLNVQSQGSRLVMTAQGEAYYEPAKTIELGSKVVRP